MAAHFPQLATLEKLGLTHIKTLEDLVVFMKQMNTVIQQSNPYQSSDRSDLGPYSKYHHKVRTSFLAWLFNFTCQECGLTNNERTFCFHHVIPEDKKFNITRQAGHKDKLSLFKELLKCVYLCENCHAQTHADMGDLDEDFKAINRRRHTYIQNLLGCTE